MSKHSLEFNGELCEMAFLSAFDPNLCLKYAFLLGAIILHEMSIILSPDETHKESCNESGIYVEDRLFGGEVVHTKVKHKEPSRWIP
jgi:hypothetical protein